MDYLDQLYAALLDAARLGRNASGRDERLRGFLPSLRTLAEEAAAAKPLYAALKAYTDAGRGESALLQCAEELRRLRLALRPDSLPPEDYQALVSREAPPDPLSSRRFESLRALLARGQLSETLREAVADGSARDARLLPYWLESLEHRGMRTLAVQVFSGWGGFGRDALLRHLPDMTAEGRQAVYDIAAAVFPEEDALELLRRAVRNDPDTRAHAMLLLSRRSRETADVAFVAGFLEDEEERDTALEALSRFANPEAELLLLTDAEFCLREQDFIRLQTVLRYVSMRATNEHGAAFYAFYQKLLPLLICRPGNHIWLVQICIDAIAAYGTPGAVAFLEEMLRLAESKAS